MDTLERSMLTQSGAVKVNGDQDNAPEADVLPLDEQGQTTKQRNVMVALTDTAIDREAIAVACKAARKHAGEVYGVYGIVVPFRLALDDAMTDQTAAANHALDEAKAVADQMKVRLDTEIIHTRHFGQSLIQEAQDHDCALIVLGVSYQLGVNGQFSLSETADYVLRNAPSRIWLVRGPCPQIMSKAAQQATQQPQQRQNNELSRV
ncbi:MAG TPA: universal stress protein [Ktedonobacterales bacterium]|nr:universal stress protein [Ktedonobacterales bacterium]